MQTTFFQDPANPDHRQDHDLGNAVIHEYPQAFSGAEANTLLSGLIHAIPWQQSALRIAGKLRNVPRLQCWMGDEESHYGYSGMRLQLVAWQADVLDIRQRVQALTGFEFNSVLLNYYRTGQDSVAWHADSEPELGADPVIASVSLGAERQFQLKSKGTDKATNYRMLLRNGSLIVLGKGLQTNWLHQLPKTKGLTLPRINLTFRQII